MKIKLFKLLSCIVAISVIIALLNISVTTRQGVNFKVRALKIPLYLKLLDFFDRHYNYKALAARVTSQATTDEQRVFNLFEWTYGNIRPQPKGFPVMDDHVWYIIVRGYGAGEQSSDVFTTLCNYAGFHATYAWIRSSIKKDEIALCFVKVRDRWLVFDEYRGAYFRNKEGKFADVEDLKNGDYSAGYLAAAMAADFDYKEYFENIVPIKYGNFTRGDKQSPLRRFAFEVGEWLKLNKKHSESER